MYRTLDLAAICAMAAARRCFDGGQSVEEIARSAKKSPETIRRWLRTTGLHTTDRRRIIS